MKKTKKLLALCLALLVAFSLVGCGDDTDDSGSQKKEYSPAVVENNVYTSQFAGLTATLDSTWTVLNDEEIAQIVGVSIDMTDDAALKESLSSGNTIYDMYAMAADGATLNITVGNLGAIYGKLLDMKTLAQSSAEQLVPAFESMGFTDVTAEVSTISFAGTEQTVIILQGSHQGITMYEQLVCMKVGDYILSITACSYGTDRTTEILSLFSAL